MYSFIKLQNTRLKKAQLLIHKEVVLQGYEVSQRL